MMASVAFNNLKVLRDATLPLAPFTLIIGPNGSGKSTVFQALLWLGDQGHLTVSSVASVGADESSAVSVAARWAPPHDQGRFIRTWRKNHRPQDQWDGLNSRQTAVLQPVLGQLKVYSLAADAIASEVSLNPRQQMLP
ncbi:MAG: AAA family ATPase, partial [Candidatus Rokubacteria bacterium]|nr:AAA family ATPase [Candidatus Rokubacteria bacterium]